MDAAVYIINNGGRIKSDNGMIDLTRAGVHLFDEASLRPANAMTGTPITLWESVDPGFYFGQWGGDCAIAGTGASCTAILGSGSWVTASIRKEFAVSTGGTSTNSPPAPPAGAGSEWLVSPADGEAGNGDTAFIWKALTDAEGDEVTYLLYICLDGDFESCTPTTVTATVTQRMAAAAGGIGAALLLAGFGFTRGGRRYMSIMLAALLITSSVTVMACGKKSSSSTTRTVNLTCADASSSDVCQDSLYLAPGTYSWKVVGSDGKGGTTESHVRTFTVE
jgi:hypothetical protein